MAILVPCYNEDRAIAKVVADFRAAVPDATIYVYDNNSTDNTAEVAKQAGAIVRRENSSRQRLRGPAHVQRRRSGCVRAR